MNEFERDTQELKETITNSKKSGHATWKAGEKLHVIKEEKPYKQKYNTFANYLKVEFRLTPETANKYIYIYQRIPFDKITDYMIVGHLYTIAKIENEQLRYEVLDTIKEVDKTIENNHDSINDNRHYIENDILIIKHIVENIKSKYIDINIKNIIKKIILDSNKTRQRNNNNKILKSLETIKIHPDFSDTLKLYGTIPINEQGLVGIFCSIFYLLKTLHFEWENQIVKFHKIYFIRTEFPDGKLELACHKQIIDIYVEFEFMSFNYWLHEHDKAKVNCDLIICWEIDEKTQKILATDNIMMPRILSIKDTLINGEIKIFPS